MTLKPKQLMYGTGEVKMELKPCPFCGGKALYATDCHIWAVICESCGARTNVYRNDDDAKEAWNRRTET